MTELLDHQPFKALYIAYFATSLVLVKLPLWTVYYLPRLNRPRRSWTVKRCLIVRLIKELFTMKVDLTPENAPAVPTEVPDATLTDAKFVWVDPIPDELFCGEGTGLLAPKKGSTWHGPTAKPGEKTVLHMHGGAFYLGTANPPHITANITRGLLQHSQSLERTFAVDYRLTSSAPHPPANPFPAALLDTIAAYRYLVQDAGFEPRDIIVAGDSAGANLAVGLIRHLLENPSPSLPPPGRLLTMSGWFDLSMSRHSTDSSAVRNAPTDIFDVPPPGTLFAEYAVTSLRGPMEFDVVKTNRYISPVALEVKPSANGLFAGYPETYVVAGGAERILDDSTALIELMKADGVHVTSDIPVDAVHDFLTFTWHEPERTKVLRRIVKWVDLM
ncbi:alpha/beta-hydrolase [Trametes sanguinea]|nr:alpha/beta-hydrolase [Trametes sanguinea]